MPSNVNKLIKSASLILIGRNSRPSPRTPVDFKTLFLQRTSRSRFHPNGLVFPGGSLETDADFSPRWRDLFKQRGLNISPRNEDGELNDDLALRICALRETFEESGILLCNDVANPSETIYGNLTRPEIEMWRDKVHKDAGEFIELFERHSTLIPCIRDLYEWGKWITPPKLLEQGGAGSNKRYITSFYTAFLAGHSSSGEKLCGQPISLVDGKEIVSARWQHPSEVADEYSHGDISLMPPQVYELARMSTFPDFSSFKKFSKHRESLGTPDWLNVRLNCDDGIMNLLPGDELYPVDPDLNGERKPLEMSGSLKHLNDLYSSRQHRILYGLKKTKDSKPLFSVHCNITIKNGHVTPISEDN